MPPNVSECLHPKKCYYRYFFGKALCINPLGHKGGGGLVQREKPLTSKLLVLEPRSRDFCQAQPQLQLSWAELALISSNTPTYPHPPLPPPPGQVLKEFEACMQVSSKQASKQASTHASKQASRQGIK